MKRHRNRHASQQIRIPVGFHKSLDVAPFLHEIERVLPTIQGTEHRTVVEGVRGFLISHSLASRFAPSYRPPSFEILVGMVETLRCAGIAPPGWPQPPGPNAFIEARPIFVPGWDGTHRNGGPQ
jgi:hypothetical protein